MIKAGHRGSDVAVIRANTFGRRIVVSCFCLFLCGQGLIYADDSQETEIRSYVRNNFEKALENERAVDELLDYLRHKIPGEPEHLPPTLMAYYGALQGLKAKFSAFPTRKLQYLKSCLKYLDQSVQEEGADLETHFLRFSSLHHLPPFFGIPKKRYEDIKMIFRLLEERDYTDLDREFQSRVVDFMLQSRRLNAQQVKDFNAFKSELAVF